MTKFSPQLVERLQKHFAEKHNAQVSDDEAQAYLDSLADLYLLVVGVDSSAPPGRGDHTAPLSLFNKHLTRNNIHEKQ